jgi:hypothetical protein
LIYQVSSRTLPEKKWQVIGQFTYNAWKDAGLAERCAAFLAWACKLGYDRIELAFMRDAIRQHQCGWGL